MHDIRRIRENPAAFDAGLARRGLPATSARVLEIDENMRAIMARVQDAQAERNAKSKQIGASKAKGEDVRPFTEAVGKLKEKIQRGEDEERALKAELDVILGGLPNLMADAVPEGNNEGDNVELRRWGEPKTFNFEVKDHVALGDELGGMDFEAAARMSGARFVVLSGAIARLERALGAFMLDLQTREFGYTEVSPPILVREEAMFGTTQLPKFAEDSFRTTNDYWLIPTAEVSLTNLVRENILAEVDLPLRFTALTQCFRSEAGSAGKDTHGMIRQHQFSKVEMVSIVAPEKSEAEHERLTGCAEEVLKRLDLAHRVVLLCAGDTGFGAHKTYDIEVWLPGQVRYREISSCSLFGDFQARRMGARYRRAAEKGTRYLHTINGSGLAVGRTLIAVLENYQQSDGSIIVPEALRPYMDGCDLIGKDWAPRRG